ncbi:MAG TPA: hypothetical protein VK645_05545 [Chitinophagaceae bacterium]|nr:hypothetical protein [Chitinophagaceae bacterium]
MRAGQLICILVCFIVLMVVSGGCAYTKKDVVEIPCAVADNISYTTDIAPIIEANCAGCHSAASLTSGILLDNYDGLKYYAQNGYLYGDISHAPGFRPMPDGEAKLNNCIIATIKKWIDTGTPH